MTSLEEAQETLRLAAQGLVLSVWDDYSRLGCKLVPELGQPQRTPSSRDAIVKAAYRKMILLIHPDKNQGAHGPRLREDSLGTGQCASFGRGAELGRGPQVPRVRPL